MINKCDDFKKSNMYIPVIYNSFYRGAITFAIKRNALKCNAPVLIFQKKYLV